MRGTSITIKAADTAKATYISREERARQIREGYWRGISCAHKSRKDYDRKREKLEVKRLSREYM